MLLISSLFQKCYIRRLLYGTLNQRCMSVQRLCHTLCSPKVLRRYAVDFLYSFTRVNCYTVSCFKSACRPNGWFSSYMFCFKSVGQVYCWSVPFFKSATHVECYTLSCFKSVCWFNRLSRAYGYLFYFFKTVHAFSVFPRTSSFRDVEHLGESVFNQFV